MKLIWGSGQGIFDIYFGFPPTVILPEKKFPVDVELARALYANQQYPAGNYMFKVYNRNTRTRCEICLK